MGLPGGGHGMVAYDTFVIRNGAYAAGVGQMFPCKTFYSLISISLRFVYSNSVSHCCESNYRRIVYIF